MLFPRFPVLSSETQAFWRPFVLGLLLTTTGGAGCAEPRPSTAETLPPPPVAASSPGQVEEPPIAAESPSEEPSDSTEELSEPAEDAPEAPPERREPLPIPEGTTVLHVGDSFAAALGLPLNRMLKEHGVRSVLEYETASYIPGWSAGDKLQRLLWKYDPDLVLITLGANELEIAEPTQRIRNIRRIVDTLGERPCVWVATPLWAGAKNGLMDIIRDNVAPCRYMDTNQLITEMARGPDKIHPTTAAREEWAKVVLHWLRTERRPTEERPWELAGRPSDP